MILSGKEIKKELGKNIFIEPFNSGQLGSNSYNLRLHNELLIYDQKMLDMKEPAKTKRIMIPEAGFVLMPGELYLGRTVEYTESTKYAPFLEGRSSTARLGLFVHITASFGNVGSSGCWTLELTVVKPLKIYSGVEVCQIYYQTVQGEAINGHSHYHASRDINPSFLYKEFEKK